MLLLAAISRGLKLVCVTGAVEPTSSSASSRSKNKSSANNCDNNPAATMRLRLENERPQSEVEQLRKLVGGGISDLEGASAVVDFDDPLRIQALEIELQHAKEALAGETYVLSISKGQVMPPASCL
jgi:hypothetical protein